MLLFFCPPLDFGKQPPIRVTRTRTEVHILARGNGVGMLSCTWHRWSPCKPGVLSARSRVRALSNLSFTATFCKHKPLIFLEKVGGLWFLASEKGRYGNAAGSYSRSYAPSTPQSGLKYIILPITKRKRSRSMGSAFMSTRRPRCSSSATHPIRWPATRPMNPSLCLRLTRWLTI